MCGAVFGEGFIAAPLGLSSVVVDSKPRYEYSSAVNTPTYNNFNYVRSADEIARTVVTAPVVAAVEPKPAIIARSDLPYYTSPYFAPSYYGSPFIRTIPSSNIVLKSDLGLLPTTRLAPLGLGEGYVIKAAEPAILPAIGESMHIRLCGCKDSYGFYPIAATPTKIVDTIVEPKIVGEAVLERKSQYHSQNVLGEATYGHREPFQTHDAVQDAFGNKVGSFSYIDAKGELLKTDYVADANGYRVKTNALPAVEKVSGQQMPVLGREYNFLFEYSSCGPADVAQPLPKSPRKQLQST